MTSEAPPETQQPDDEPQRWTLVATGGTLFGIPFERVREVIPARALTPIPGTPPGVRGLANRRGRVLTVVDLGACLGWTPATESPAHRVVVVAHGDREIGVAVEEVLRVAPVAASALRPLSGEAGFVTHAGESEGQTFHAVDATALLQPLFG